MTETGRTAAFAWAAAQLSWERRLRELEDAPAAEPAPPTPTEVRPTDAVSVPANPTGSRRRRGSPAPAR